MTTWLLITVRDTVHGWDIGDPTVEWQDEAVMRARVLVSFPAGSWLDTDRRVQFTQGEPHARTLARIQVHPAAELTTVSASALATYRADCANADRGARGDSVHAAITALPTDEQAALRTRLGWNGGPRPS